MYAAVPVFVLMSASILAQPAGLDMAALQKWGNAKMIRYHIVGVHNARVVLATATKGDATDRVTVDFDWDAKGRKPAGEIRFVNEKTQLRNVAADGTKCSAPAVHGAYEHFEAQKASVPGRGQIELKGTRTIPSVDDPQWPAGCSPKATVPKTEEVLVYIGLAEPQLLAMPPGISQKGLTIAADRRSYTLAGGDQWVWTVTPVILQ